MQSLLLLPALAAPPTLQIVNGEVEYGFPAVVALGAGSGTYTFSACTGSLITPRMVLSAAHCGDGLPLETVVALGKAYFGTDVTEPDEVRGFVDLAIHPDYEELESGFGGSLGQYDVSVLVLDEDAPVPAVRLNSRAMGEADVGLMMKSVGFGITSASASDSGTKRSVELALDDVDEMFLYSEGRVSDGEGQICSGDSGGPQFALLDGSEEWIQVAVHSWGDSQCKTQSGSTRVDVAMPWILEQVARVHGTDDLCEINGRYGDGLCEEWCPGADPDCALADSGEEGAKGGCSTLSRRASLLALFGGPLLTATRRRAQPATQAHQRRPLSRISSSTLYR